MSNEMNWNHDMYEKEAKEKYGESVVEETKKRVLGMSQTEKEKFEDILGEIAAHMDLQPNEEEVQNSIRKWYEYLNQNFGSYSYEAFKGLGQLYVQDVRFTENMEKYGIGFATFLCEAMCIFSDGKQKSSEL